MHGRGTLACEAFGLSAEGFIGLAAWLIRNPRTRRPPSKRIDPFCDKRLLNVLHNGGDKRQSLRVDAHRSGLGEASGERTRGQRTGSRWRDDATWSRG